MTRILTLLAIALAASASWAENCRYSQTTSILEKAMHSKDSVLLAKRTYEPRDARFLQGIRIEQIMKMTEQVLRAPSRSLSEAIQSFDENRIYRYDFTTTHRLPAEFYTVIFAFAGDTEVGAVFEGATSKMVAEIADGDIKLCTPYWK